jgi:hypothetical protein
MNPVSITHLWSLVISNNLLIGSRDMFSVNPRLCGWGPYLLYFFIKESCKRARYDRDLERTESLNVTLGSFNNDHHQLRCRY